MRIGLVTCLNIPEPDPDERIQMEAISAAGGEAVLVPWDDPSVDLSSFDRLILRSCWDYPWRESEFREWLRHADGKTELFNPIEVVNWNLHKGYLLDLARAGVPVVPTRVLPAGADSTELAEILDDESWQQFVIKPAVSAGSWLTDRFQFDERDRAREFVEEHGKTRDLLLQPYIQSVEEGGERANVYMAGTWSHCVKKSPRFIGAEEQVGEALSVLPEDVALGQQALECSPAAVLYGRVDTVRDSTGAPMVAELELIEPTLFLSECHEARELFGRSCLLPTL